MSRHLERVRRSLLCIVLTAGCFEPPCESASEPGGPFIPCATPSFDAGRRDGGIDAGVMDAGRVDAGRVDAGRGDAGVVDAGRVDAGFDAGVLPTSDAGVRVVDFGLVSGRDGGFARDFVVPIEPSDEGFLIEVLGVSPELDVFQTTRIVSPRGVVLAQGRDVQQHRTRSRPNLRLANALVLESDDARGEWAPGAWRFRVESWMPTVDTAATVKVYVKPRPPPGVQRVGLNLFFTGSAGLTAATAPTQPRLVGALRGLQALFLDAGIAVDPPRLVDLPPGFSAVTSRIDEDAGLPMVGTSLEVLFQQSRGAPQGLNLFFVESLELDPRLPPGAVLGVAGGVPGTTMTNGTGSSGVAILFDEATFVPRMGEADPLGLVLTHEVGHQLGLSHVFELDGEQDNLSDTPRSGAAAEANIMAPFAAGGSQWSPLQGVTLRRNPVVRP